MITKQPCHSDFSLTYDAFLGEKVYLYQPEKGFRAGLDSVFLSAALSPLSHEKILDVGSGVGVVGLLLLSRLRERTFHEEMPTIIGLEKNKQLVEIAQKNALLNQMGPFYHAIKGDIQNPPSEIQQTLFDHVVSNPPFFEGTMTSPNDSKAMANHPSTVSFEEWILFCIRRLKSFGKLTLIVPPAKLPSVLRTFEGKMGEILVYPLWPRAYMPAKRLLIQGTKGRKSPLHLLSGLVLHDASHVFTPQAREILWEGKPLVWRASP